MAKTRRKYYAVIRGKKPGVYTKWFGPDGAETQVKGFANALYKGFANRSEAQAALKSRSISGQTGKSKKRALSKFADSVSISEKPGTERPTLTIYTDGGCKYNPGPGGYGIVIRFLDGSHKEYSAGYRLTTNNRMELLAAVVGLSHVPPGETVRLYSDSSYVVNAMTKGWISRWRSNGWKKANGQNVLNADLWARLMDIEEKRDVSFHWVKGHAGDPLNERCDELAGQAALASDLPADEGFENR